MNVKQRMILENVFEALGEVGEHLTAIDHNTGEEIVHWQSISALSHTIRRQAGELPDEIFTHLPALAVFTLAIDSIDSCWGRVMNELEVYLRNDQYIAD